MSNLEIAENFDSNLETVEPKFFLEELLGITEVEMAPAMEIQTQEISEAFLENPELQYENWKELSPQGRVNALQNFECEVAKIVHRDVLPVKSGDLGNCVYGQYSPYTNDITVSESLINSNSQEDYLQTLNTYFHESRHAYQFYNLLTERTEPNSELYESWNINLNVLGYNPGDYGLFGYEQRYRLMVFFIAVRKRLIRRRNVCGKRIKSSLLFYVRMKRKSLDKRWKCDRAVTRHNLKLRNRLYTKNSHKILRFRKIC